MESEASVLCTYMPLVWRPEWEKVRAPQQRDYNLRDQSRIAVGRLLQNDEVAGLGTECARSRFVSQVRKVGDGYAPRP